MFINVKCNRKRYSKNEAILKVGILHYNKNNELQKVAKSEALSR